tara:strand:- start:90 stop:1043 length:954 start_codon:yes stop_codon:yes gene_type:complete
MIKYLVILLLILQSCNSKKQEQFSTKDKDVLSDIVVNSDTEFVTMDRTFDYKVLDRGNSDVLKISNISESLTDSTTIYLKKLKNYYLNLPDSLINKNDSNNQKQGTWLVYFAKQKEVLSEIINYVDNKKHGLCIEYEKAGYHIETQTFLNGNKLGFKRWYRNFGKNSKRDKWGLISIVYYENDTLLWSQKPYHNGYEGYFKSNWLYTKYDTTPVKFHYENDNVWYNGLFIKNEPIGIHNTYYATGILRMSTNFDKSEIKKYDRQGRLTILKKGEITERELQNGIEEHYDINGKLLEIWTYKHFNVIEKNKTTMPNKL